MGDERLSIALQSSNDWKRLNARRENDETNGHYTFIGNNKLPFLFLSQARFFRPIHIHIYAGNWSRHNSLIYPNALQLIDIELSIFDLMTKMTEHRRIEV